MIKILLPCHKVAAFQKAAQTSFSSQIWFLVMLEQSAGLNYILSPWIKLSPWFAKNPKLSQSFNQILILSKFKTLKGQYFVNICANYFSCRTHWGIDMKYWQTSFKIVGDVERVFKTFRAVMYSEKRICHFKLGILKTQDHPHHLLHIGDIIIMFGYLLQATKDYSNWCRRVEVAMLMKKPIEDVHMWKHWNVETVNCDLSIWNKSD